MGSETTPSRPAVQSAGQGRRLRGQAIKAEFGRSGPVLHLLPRYTQALITQMAHLVRLLAQAPEYFKHLESGRRFGRERLLRRS